MCLGVNVVTCRQQLVFSCRINENPSLTAKGKGQKRKIAETSNVITETLPSVEGEQVSTAMAVTLKDVHRRHQVVTTAQYMTRLFNDQD